MGLFKKLTTDTEEVDIIIVGGKFCKSILPNISDEPLLKGGTAGCIVAGRLAEADPGLSILVVEGGPDNYDKYRVLTPGLYLTNLLPESETTIFHKSVGSKYIADRERIVPSGGTLGGGSSINFMM